MQPKPAKAGKTAEPSKNQFQVVRSIATSMRTPAPGLLRVPGLLPLSGLLSGSLGSVRGFRIFPASQCDHDVGTVLDQPGALAQQLIAAAPGFIGRIRRHRHDVAADVASQRRQLQGFAPAFGLDEHAGLGKADQQPVPQGITARTAAAAGRMLGHNNAALGPPPPRALFPRQAGDDPITANGPAAASAPCRAIAADPAGQAGCNQPAAAGQIIGESACPLAGRPGRMRAADDCKPPAGRAAGNCRA